MKNQEIETTIKRPVLTLSLGIRKNIEEVKTVKKKVVFNNFKAKEQKVANPEKKVNAGALPKDEYKKILKNLREKYPDIFGEEIKVLALAIHTEVAKAADISNNMARKFLRVYCRTKHYKTVRIIGANRYDLAGNITGQVTEEENN